MKHVWRRLGALLLSVLLLCAALGSAALADTAGDGVTATILFTHDMHSHLLPAPKEEGGEYGGFARLMTALEAERAISRQNGVACLTVDGGDFAMGTLFQTVYTSQATELRSLGALGFDATTFGNHEYEYRADGLAKMLNAAMASGDPLPAIVQSNYLPPKEGQEGYDETAQAVWDALEAYGVTDYTMVEREGVRFAVFGVLGQDADDCAPMSGMVFEPIAQAAQRVVDEIRANEDYDFIICLSHSGTNPDPKKSEDEQLAKAVQGIDFIVSGHTHSTLSEPKIVGNTVIGCVGEYCNNLGKLTLHKNADGTNSVLDYQLIPINEQVKDDPTAAAKIQSYKELVEQDYLAQFNMTYDQVLAHTPFAFTPISKFAVEQEEDGLGNLITDAYIYAVEQAEGGTGAPITAAFVNSGVIRASFAQGDITVSDAFNVSSIGSGADGSPGYPLIDVYLTGAELKNVFEVDPSVGPIFAGAQLYSSGVSYKFNMHRLIFNRTYDPALMLPDGTRAPIEDDTLYRVVTNLYSSQMLGLVTDKSFGILKVTPKDAQGQPITDYEAHIIHLPDGGELKEWYAVATYLSSFDKEDGVSQVPLKYAAPEGRKERSESRNPIELLKQPRWTTVLVIALVVVLLAVVVLVVWLIATRKRRRGRRRRSAGSYRRYRG